MLTIGKKYMIHEYLSSGDAWSKIYYGNEVGEYLVIQTVDISNYFISVVEHRRSIISFL